MTPKTEVEYRRLAAYFYKTRLAGQPLTPKAMADALKGCAGEYRPAYWRRLRNAIAFDMQMRGYSKAAARINATQNPLTASGDFSQVKPRQSRVRRVSEVDEHALLTHLKERGDLAACAAIIAVKLTGCRPAELGRVQVDTATGNVWIEGAKKSHGGTRGADRLLQLPQREAGTLAQAIKLIGPVGPIQDRIRAAGKRLWPRRKAVPTLYSWRHQMGSDLKASGMERVEIAYVMGHQATASVDQYGDRRMGRGGGLPMAADNADLSQIRVTHMVATTPAPAPRSGPRMG